MLFLCLLFLKPMTKRSMLEFDNLHVMLIDESYLADRRELFVELVCFQFNACRVLHLDLFLLILSK